jgi:hypothetical protein
MTSPRPARRLVEWFLEPRLADALIGDLDEIFAAEVGRAPLSARLNYCRRAAGALWHLRHRRAGRTIADSPGDGFMSTLLRDFARGLRLFTSQPAFSWAAVVTLALAIGANTLIFTIANVLVLKPLPFANEARLGWILTTLPGGVADRGGVSLPEYATFRDEVSTLTGLAAWRRQSVTLRERDQSERVLAQMVIGDLQALWGLHAVRGRTLSAGDEQRGAPHVATLSHRFWNTRFGGADDVIGRELLVEGAPPSSACSRPTSSWATSRRSTSGSPTPPIPHWRRGRTAAGGR